MTKTFVLAAIIAALFTVPASAQSLADAAKKAKEERTKGMGWPEPAARTAPVTPPADAAPATPATDDKSASTTETEKSKPAKTAKSATDSGPQTEAYWRGRLAPIRERLAATLSKVVTMRRRIVDLTEDLYSLGALNARRGGVEAERQRLITEADGLDREAAADRAALADIEEEGRRAGALPGWLR